MPDAAVASDRRKVSRESRVSLPDETARYLNYNHMIESPIGSPALGGSNSGNSGSSHRDGSVPPSPLRGVPEDEAEAPVPIAGPSKLSNEVQVQAAQSVSSFGEFLELEAEENSTESAPVSRRASETAATQQIQQTLANGNTKAADTRANLAALPGPPPARPPRRARSTDVVEFSQTSSQSSGTDLASLPEERASMDAYVAPSARGAPSISAASSTTLVTPSAASPSGQTKIYSNPGLNHSNPNHEAPTPAQVFAQSQGAPPRSSQQHQQPPQIGSQPTANASSTDLVHKIEYKSAKLTNDDLPHTTVRVEGSTIKSNDRGKEVLSFVITVMVKGKEPWKVEKLYSDVLTLDGRVRGSSGKTQGKKIAPLPDSKLFKDNAPAKVDQRKAVLEVYLQSLIQANMKTKDDICMFFSTGIMRPKHSPVHQNGHKEGYLTKRSKSFGGCVFSPWQTRCQLVHNSC